MVDLSKLNFWSGVNYMKRIDDPNLYTDVSLGSFGTATVVVPHNLNKIPEYDVQAELQADGVIWTGTKPFVGMNQGFASPDAVSYDTWIDEENLTITLKKPDSGSIVVRVYHIIYKDYA